MYARHLASTTGAAAGCYWSAGGHGKGREGVAEVVGRQEEDARDGQITENMTECDFRVTLVLLMLFYGTTKF